MRNFVKDRSHIVRLFNGVFFTGKDTVETLTAACQKGKNIKKQAAYTDKTTQKRQFSLRNKFLAKRTMIDSTLSRSKKQ